MGLGVFCVSQGGIRWVLCESGWDQVDSVCVSGGFRWVLCESRWNQVDSV